MNHALRIGEGWDTHALVAGRALILGGVRIDVGADGIHLGIAGADDTQFIFAVVNEAGAGLGADELLDGIESGLVIADEALLGAEGLAIPRAVVFPAAEEAGFIDVALLSDDEVRLFEDAMLGEAFQSLPEAAAGIDDPCGPLSAEGLDHVAKPWMIHGATRRIDHGAIEIEAEDEAVLLGGHGAVVRIRRS